MGYEQTNAQSNPWVEDELESQPGQKSRRNRRLCRRHIRTQASVEIVRDGEAMAFDCVDLSAVGLFLHAQLLFDLGEHLELQISLPGQPRPIHATGQVIRTQTDDDGMGAGMGVAFRDISRQEQACLERYLMRRFLGHG